MTIRSTLAAKTCFPPSPGHWREMQVVRGSTFSISARVASARRARTQSPTAGSSALQRKVPAGAASHSAPFSNGRLASLEGSGAFAHQRHYPPFTLEETTVFVQQILNDEPFTKERCETRKAQPSSRQRGDHHRVWGERRYEADSG